MNTKKRTQIYVKTFVKKIRIKMVNEELLAEAFRKCTVLYDKYRANFTDKRKKLITWNDCNWTRTQNHLVLKRTLNKVWPNG